MEATHLQHLNHCYYKKHHVKCNVTRVDSIESIFSDSFINITLNVMWIDVVKNPVK